MASQPFTLPDPPTVEAMSAEEILALVRRASSRARSRSPAPSRRRRRCCSTCCSRSSRRRASSRSTRTTSSRRRTSSGARSSSATTRRSRCSKGRAPSELAATHGEELWERKPDLYLAIAQGRAARPCARRPRRLDHRHPPRPVADARERAEARLGRGARAVEGEPARRLERRRLLGVHPRARAALQRAARPRLRTRSATPTRRCRAPAARAAGRARDRTECGLHVEEPAS